MSSLNIVYLIQVRSDSLHRYAELLSRDDVDVILLTYDKPIDNALYYPNSMWGEGRNKLLEEALKRKKGYLYYIFLDGDIGFEQGDYRLFEKNLLKYAPAVAYPIFSSLRYNKLGVHFIYERFWFAEMQVGTFGDGQFQAVHRDVVKDGLMVPYCQSENIWSDDKITRIKSLFYYNYTLQFNHIVVENLEHGGYTGQWDVEMCNKDIKFWQKKNLRKNFPAAMLNIPILLPLRFKFFGELFRKESWADKICRLYYDLRTVLMTIFYKPKECYCLDPAVVNKRLKKDSPLWRQYHSRNRK